MSEWVKALGIKERDDKERDRVADERKLEINRKVKSRARHFWGELIQALANDAKALALDAPNDLSRHVVVTDAFATCHVHNQGKAAGEVELILRDSLDFIRARIDRHNNVSGQKSIGKAHNYELRLDESDVLYASSSHDEKLSPEMLSERMLRALCRIDEQA